MVLVNLLVLGHIMVINFFVLIMTALAVVIHLLLIFIITLRLVLIAIYSAFVVFNKISGKSSNFLN